MVLGFHLCFSGLVQSSKLNLFNSNNELFFVSTFQQKFTTAGSSQFVPSLNAITSNQDLQWLVQPSVFSMPGPSRVHPRPPYPLPTRPGSVNPQPAQSHFLRPGVITAAAMSNSSTRRKNDEHVSFI